MRIVPRNLLSGILLFAVFVAGCDRGDHPSHIGQPAEAFHVSDGQQTADLSSLRGRIVIVNFWATWCPPCVEELPSLVALQHRMPQIAVVAISQDDDPAAYRDFLQKHQVDFLTVRDPSGRIPALYGTVKIPESYIVDKNGIVRRKFVSAQNWTSPEITDYLDKLSR